MTSSTTSSHSRTCVNTQNGRTHDHSSTFVRDRASRAYLHYAEYVESPNDERARVIAFGFVQAVRLRRSVMRDVVDALTTASIAHERRRRRDSRSWVIDGYRRAR